MKKYVVAVFMYDTNELSMFCSISPSEYDALVERYAGYFGTENMPATAEDIFEAFLYHDMVIEVLAVE